jgi:hypothetical protein
MGSQIEAAADEEPAHGRRDPGRRSCASYGLEVGQEAAMVSPPSLAFTSAPILRRHHEEP